ncbi:CYTH and CHAD domain-containing protein [Hydrogenophaga sp.]|uniref:CYTH and CHAD domain-containing protein n=1 Tax=Hydrogenophaga sp. TaxID=1904254 RepID=UPI0025C608C1|nr:CYTH and CHAD domain-containing protein [Hydrogenophaga sp.]
MSNTEIELKLLLPGADASDIEGRLRSLPVLARRKSQSQWLWNCYFDTPEETLRAQRSALRLRCVSDTPWRSAIPGFAPDGEWIQTFKSAGTSLGGLSERGEWESRVTIGSLNETALRKTPWSHLDAEGHLFAALCPCFDTRCRRTTWQLQRYQGASIEVALDVGEIVAGERNLPILELELELKSGPAESLFELAQTIAHSIAVLPCDASKAERGYQLTRGHAQAPRRAKMIHLDKRASPLEAAQAAFAETYEHLTRNLSGLTDSDDPELVHQARVGWRRWRSAKWLFSAWLPRMPEFEGLKPLLNALGLLRDLDVLRYDTLASWLPTFLDSGNERLCIVNKAIAQIDKARSQRRVQLRSQLASPATGAALVGLSQAMFELAGVQSTHAVVRKKKGKKAQTSQWANERMTTLRRRLERTLKSSNEPGAPVELIHRSRLQAKRARYAAEMLGDVLPPETGSKLARKATAIQTRVGADRDLQQAITLLQSLNVDASLITFLQGVLAGRSDGKIAH